MTTKIRPSTKRSLLLDVILGAALTIIILTSTLRTIEKLVTQPDRPAWSIALDWIGIILIVAIIAFFVVSFRKISADLDRRDAERAAEKAAIREVIAASHAERPNPHLTDAAREALEKLDSSRLH
jgi:hypothetical protein